jgi:hypothetical protein
MERKVAMLKGGTVVERYINLGPGKAAPKVSTRIGNGVKRPKLRVA